MTSPSKRSPLKPKQRSTTSEQSTTLPNQELLNETNKCQTQEQQWRKHRERNLINQ